MDAFVAMRHFLMQNGGFVNRLSNVEAKIIDQDERILLPLLAFDILLHLLSLLFANLP